jgi:glutathione synthase/RimK-type ligase-like ATP-grasp enzyme
MKNKTVIVASHDKDQSALFLMKRLVEISQPARLINFGEFPTAMYGTILFEKTVSASLTSLDNLRFDDNSIKSIWWRRPQGSVKNTKVSLLQKYIQNESDITLSCLLNFLKGVMWVSEPEATRVANRKPLQLALAKQIGFNVPETCVSNEPEHVKAFIARHSGIPLIMKAVGSSYIRLTHDPEDKSRKNRAIYTRVVDTNLLLKNINRVANCPFILQEAVIKDSDIRITVVGDRVFASEIIIEKNADGLNLDWRHHDVKRKYVMHKLPQELEGYCARLVSSLGLKFGCIDMGFSKKNGYAFFEINPQGQWMPSEQLVGHPISLALANLLSS